ncbi:transcriptional regulator [Marasmius fiardii PR-910]|nr:transcriptional regulator [Marasmius fiardii PR-910]
MYLRGVHAEEEIPALRDFIKNNPLGIFTTAFDSPNYPFIQSSHIPFILDVKDEESKTELGVLRGHMARANPQSKALIEHLQVGTVTNAEDSGPPKLERDVLVVFNHPTHHYVTPKFYRETKSTTGKVAPTWNYAAVQAYGKLTVYFDTKASHTDDFLSKQIDDLSRWGEREIMKYEAPWTVEDAPRSFIEVLKKAIIGIEIEITSLGGKYKMSQEMSKGDREGVIEGFRALSTDVGTKISGMVKERGELLDRKKEAKAV